MEVALVNLKSSTADSEEQPKIEWEQFDLLIKYKNWQNEIVTLKFFDVPHFKLLSSDESIVSHLSDDRVYDVRNSELLNRLIECGEITQNEQYKHWLVGFNEIGSFVEVIFKYFDEK